MKLIALILLFSFGAYLSEAVLLPRSYFTASHFTASHTKVDRCMHVCKMMQQNKKCQNQNTKNKCKQSCSNCPVFASFYPNVKNATAILFVSIIHYPNFVSRFISDYSGETWKPPNTL